MGSMLKVTRISDANDRILIKDIKGLVQDVSFALTSIQIILGVVDEAGNLFVYNIDDKKALKYVIMLFCVLNCVILTFLIEPLCCCTSYIQLVDQILIIG